MRHTWTILTVALSTLTGCTHDPQFGEQRLEVHLALGVVTPDSPDLGLHPGLLAVPNLDDDDDNGTPDWQELWVPGEDDFASLTLTADKAPVVLQLSGHVDQVRIWREDHLLLGAHPDGDRTEAVLPAGDPVRLAVEVANVGVAAELNILGAQQSITINLASTRMLLGHHLQPTTQAWVVSSASAATGTNQELVQELQQVLGDRLTVISGDDVAGDVWIQDELEFTHVLAPESAQRLVINSVRDRGLDSWPARMWVQPNQSEQTWGKGFGNSQDSFGNLEVTPPMTLGGVSYPFGRIYYGTWNDSAPKGDLRDILAQQVQAPFSIDVSWLCVGHVDEVFSFVPDSSAPRGFRLAFVDIPLAYAIIDGMDPATELPRYAPGAFVGHNIASIGEIQENMGLRAYNQSLQDDWITPTLDQLRTELAITDEEVIRLPALFEESASCGALSLIPNLVNFAVITEPSGRPAVFMPDPFLRADPADRSSDPLIAAAQSAMPSSVDLHFLDDWEVYHMAWGEVHCATNAQRSMPAEWWTEALHLVEETW